MADQIAVSLTSVIRGMDEDVKQPHVHQFSAGITREIMWNMAVEARYVGTRGRDIWRGVDLNQLDAVGALGGAFAADFQRARQNGFLALAAGGGFVPDFNPSIPGSQVLTVLPTFGQLDSGERPDRHPAERAGASRRPLHDDGRRSTAARPGRIPAQPRHLCVRVREQHLVPGLRRACSSSCGVSSGTGSSARSTTRSAKRDPTRSATPARTASSRSSTTPGRELDTGYSIYHNAHVINANAIVELPFGQGKRWLNGADSAMRFLGGWQLATIVKWQSGAPLSITRRAARSTAPDDRAVRRPSPR